MQRRAPSAIAAVNLAATVDEHAHDLHLPCICSDMQWASISFVLNVGVCSLFEKKAHYTNASMRSWLR